MRRYTVGLLAGLVGAATAATAAEPTGADILRRAGITGGLVVHVGCGDGRLTASLRGGEGLLVQGLDRSAENVAAARARFAELGLAGKVTARRFDGRHLPYRDNMVNLLVVTDPACRVAEAEILRVLAPGGAAEVGGRLLRKPRPAEMDDWTHYQHDPQGTMVSRDRLVAPLRGIQWLADPKWLRNHDFMSSMHAMVAAGGRVFYVLDEGLRNHIFLPSKWVLIARDAFNGVELWRRELKDWHPQTWPLKSGPGQFPRRLVAVGGRVYVTFGQTEPLTVLDAATGRTVRVLEGTKATEEVLCDDGVLFLLVNPARKKIDYRAAGTSYKEIGRASNGWGWKSEGPPEAVMAVDAPSGRTLWKHPDRIAPLTLTVGEGKVFYHNGTAMVALDRKTGRRLWASAGPAVKAVGTGGALRVVYSDGVVVFAAGTKMTAFAAADGRTLWNQTLLHSSHHCPNDLFVIDGLIWSANTGTPQKSGTHLKAVDLHSGEVKKDFRAKNLPAFPMHPRCYPSRATVRYLLTNGIGTEFYRLGGDSVEIQHYIRGSCVYGVMPANGLLYKPADSCACYYQSKLEHFCALSPASALKEAGPAGAGEPLEKGPAWGKLPADSAAAAGKADWPMYRRDIERSGSTPAALPARPQPLWEAKIGGRLTQPVAAGGRVFVCSQQQQALYALDGRTGKVLWRHLAGGRIDSPPTLYGGAVLFGCGDGWVYCLRAADGALAWRYRVAPADVQIVARGQVESIWPVHGSVLVVRGVLYALAGRNLFFDGGLRLVRLDPATGRRLSQTVMDHRDPETGKDLQTLIQAKYMPVANADILSSDGERLFMQEQNFTLDGKRTRIAPTVPGRGGPAGGDRPHLFCQTGLLDDVWFHRSYWIYGSDCGEGWGAYARTRGFAPSGRILAFDAERVYAYRSEPLGNMLHPRQTYKLYATAKNPAAGAEPKTQAPAGRRARRGAAKPRTRSKSIPTLWATETPGMLVNAMVLAPGRLAVAGPPDLADETKMLGYLPGADEQFDRQLAAQRDAWEGRRGGLLRIVDTADGKTLAECTLPTLPVFDGLSAAGGRLLVSLHDGRILCLGDR